MRRLILLLVLLAAASPAVAAELPRGAGGRPSAQDFADAWGVRAEDVRSRFAADGDLTAVQIGCSLGINLAHPGETPVVQVQLQNAGDRPLAVSGRWILVQYGLTTRSQDVFDLGLRRIGESAVAELADCQVPAKGFLDLTVTVPLPETCGGYALLLERSGGPRLFVAGLTRTLAPDLGPGERFYQVCMDLDYPQAIERLHTAPNRIGIPFVASDDKRYAAHWETMAGRLRGIARTGYPVCVEFGAGPAEGAYLPLGRSRPHLDEHGTMKETKTDIAWLPSYDADFKAFVKRFALEFGWPKGPVNAMKLWNEPWNGISISGWGADDPRYREIFTALCEGVEEARAEGGVRILIGGCDSSSNTLDKLFPDGDLSFLPRLDFMSLHYQGLNPSNPRFLRERVAPEGRTLLWDTESWVANSEDRVPSVLAAMLAAGHDRLVGIQSHSVVATRSLVQVQLPDGRREPREVAHSWPVAPAQVAFQHFIGNRRFKELLWRGLPWVFHFAGRPGGDGAPRSDDLTLVVCGDLGPFFTPTRVAMRSVRGLAELRHEAELRARLVALPADAPERTALQARIDALEPVVDAHLALPADPRWALYDGSGNPVAAAGGRLTVPLSGSGWYLRPSGAPGSGEALLAAVRGARVDGYEPLDTVVRDVAGAMAPGAVVRLELRNVLNRPVAGSLAVSATGLRLEAPATLTFAAHEVRVIALRVIEATASPSNQYPLRLRFAAGADGIAEHEETIRADVIARRAITVDGDLSEWQGAVPQIVTAGGGAPTLEESAWLPMVEAGPTLAKGLATAWVAADDRGFAFAARIADATPDPGMFRYATLDESYCFYPEISYQHDAAISRAPRLTRVGGDRRITTRDGGRCDQAWEPVSRTMALALDLPGERLVSLYCLDGDESERRSQRIVARDAAGKELAKREIRQFGRGTWVRLRLSGQVIIEVTSTTWLGATLAAVAVDPVPADAAKGPVLDDDTTTCGSVADRYGSDLLLLPGVAPAGSVTARWSDVLARTEHRWPQGVRRFSYRRAPELPNGAAPHHDNVQLAFNVLPADQKSWLPEAPGTFPGYAGYRCTDYEYALNPVAAAHGGGTEIWRLRAPWLPDKHFYPRSPRHPREGAVAEAELVVRRAGGHRIVEARIPWAEIPEVQAARAAGRPIRFSYRVNDDAGSSCMELARDRSVSKPNGSFKPDWVEHWANELEFAWE